MKPRRGAGLAALLALVAGGCDWYYNTLPSPDDLMKLVPWFDHMITSPAVHPYARADIPRTTVPGTVPVHVTEPDWGPEWTRGNWAVADRLVNPTDPVEVMAVGDTLYRIFCGLCHGPAGAGDGLVGRRMGAPSLLTPQAMGRSDGHIYSVIRYGRGVMFRYGDKIVEPERRWAVVHYVRRLQANAGGGAGAVP
jgi:mono/diheme cytochrome c family protein